jgi:cation:H+ antiporter
MAWLVFLGSSILVVVAATQLARYGDVIAVRTRLGGMFIGALLMASATSLPEFLTIINSLRQGVPNLSAGDLFGSNMFNMLVLALLDLFFPQVRILRGVAMKHALTAGLAALLIGMAVFFLLADINLSIGWVGLDSLLIMAAYVGGVRLLRSGSPGGAVEVEAEGMPGLLQAFIGFAIATIVLILASPWLVYSAKEIAEVTGLGIGFVGTAMVALVTSLPEMVTAVTAVRLGAYDLAIGNLFGSNMFNMFALGMADLFFLSGRFLGIIDPAFALTGLIGLLLTSLGLIGNLARVEHRLIVVEVDALLIMLGYGFGIWLLSTRGIGL